MKNALKINDEVIIEINDLQQLLDALKEKNYETIGPTIRDHVILYGALRSVSQLPVGRHDEQGPGTYRLQNTGDNALFGYVLGPHSWKRYLYEPVVRLWRSKREARGFKVVEENYEIPQYAFFGVRSCEIRAIQALDRVFNTKKYSDSHYNGIRKKTFIVAVNCTRPGANCFCTSMSTGPKASSGFDIALTEILDNGRHYFIAEVGSLKGSTIIGEIHHRNAGEKEKNIAENILKKASGQMGRTLDTSDLKRIFDEEFDHPHWERVSERCLTCGNCTMVCPTCFCNTMEDINTLDGAYAERRRIWDSCFTKDFSYIHGGSIRASEKSRYRQWLTHKLVTWQDQFGTLGCVGCGRCITWCPVGIDITEEARTIMNF